MLLVNYENNQQPKESQYQIQLGISTQNFSQKPNGTEIRKNLFIKESFSIPEMVEKIKQGHCFSHNFNTQQLVYGLSVKTINNFDHTSYIWIDIDKSNCDLKTFYYHLQHKPTIAYTTLSNSVNNYRYRIHNTNEFTVYFSIIDIYILSEKDCVVYC
jgi:hypothetical protein